MKKKSLFNLTFPNVLFALMWLPTTASAQDILVTENGDAIKAWQVDMGGSKIYYRDGEGENAALKSIDKSSVLVWKKADGSRVVVDKNGESTSTATASQPASATPSASADDPVANKQRIAAFNRSVIEFVGKKGKSKPGGGVMALLHVDEASAIADKNVELNFAREGSLSFATGQGITVTAKNKTNRTIYIHLGNTFFLRNGVAMPYNYSSATQSMGGGMQPNSTSYSQNVVAVPPMSTFKMGVQKIGIDDASSTYGSNFYSYRNNKSEYALSWSCKPEELANTGEEKDFTPQSSPIKFGFNLTYSFSEDNAQPYHLNTQLYVSKIIGVKLSLAMGWTTAPFQATVSDIAGSGDPLTFVMFQSTRGGGGKARR